MAKPKRAKKLRPTPAPRTRTDVNLVPATWRVAQWDRDAPHVFPHTTLAGRTLVRTHARELTKARAVTRIGRQLVMMGAAYMQWLANPKNLQQVTDYSPPGINQQQGE